MTSLFSRTRRSLVKLEEEEKKSYVTKKNLFAKKSSSSIRRDALNVHKAGCFYTAAAARRYSNVCVASA